MAMEAPQHVESHLYK